MKADKIPFETAFGPRRPGTPPVAFLDFHVDELRNTSPELAELDALSFQECMARDQLELAKLQEAQLARKRLHRLIATRLRDVSWRHAAAFAPIWEERRLAGDYERVFPTIPNKASLDTWAFLDDMVVAVFLAPGGAPSGDTWSRALITVAFPTAYLEADGVAQMQRHAGASELGTVPDLEAIVENVRFIGLPSRQRALTVGEAKKADLLPKPFTDGVEVVYDEYWSFVLGNGADPANLRTDRQTPGVEVSFLEAK